jgi:hypothetical protein
MKTKSFNILVTDDETLTRQSTIRIIYNCAKELGKNINIIEVQDGIETIYCVYKCWSLGIEISMIFSDENMVFLNGLTSSQVLLDLSKKHNKNCIPFYLVTAYEGDYISKNFKESIKQILSKPLDKIKAKNIMKDN